MLPHRVCRLAVAASLACSLSCKPNEGTTEPAAEPVSAAGVIVGDAEVVRVEHPAQMLPRDTQMVGWVAGAERLAEVFERDRLVAKFPKVFQDARSEMVGDIGYDLLDPAAYAAAGVDTKGRMGGAMLSARDNAAAIFFTLSDAGKFKAAVRDAAGRNEMELNETQFGPSSLLSDPRGQWKGGVVIRDSFAMFVTQSSRDDVTLNYAEVIAKLDPRQSLAASVEYRKALGGLRDTDAMAFVNLGLIIAAEYAEQAASQASDSGAAALADAKARGATAEEIAAIEEQVARDREWQERYEARQAAERELVETLIDGVEGMGMAMSVKRTGPVVDGQVVLRDDAFLRRLVNKSPEGLSLPKALNGEPIAMWGGNVDVDAAVELLDILARAEGENLHDASLQMKEKLLGINPTTELQPQLTGEAMFAVTLEAPIDYTHLDELPKQLGVTVQVKIKDPAAVEKLLGKAAGSKTLAGMAMSKKDGAYEFAVPDFRTMRAVVAGDSLLVTTDKGLAGRVATGAEGSMRRDTHPPGPYFVTTLPNVGAAWTTNIGYIAGFFFAGFSSSHEMFDSAEAGAPSWDEVEKSRMSRASKKKKAELADAKTAADKARKDFEGAQTKAMADGILPLGTTAFVLQPNERGFSLAGGQFIGTETLGGVVEAMMTLAQSDGGNADRSALDKADQKHNQLRLEYRELRMKDYERSNKGGRSKSKVKRAKPKAKAK